MIPRVTAAGRVRAYLADHPHATIPEIAAALGMTYAQAKEGKRLVLTPRSDGPRAPRETLMARGAGERRHDCAGYEACLAGAADRYPGAAHCPWPCPSYQDRDHSVDVATGATVARESREGGLGEAQTWAAGGEW